MLFLTLLLFGFAVGIGIGIGLAEAEENPFIGYAFVILYSLGLFAIGEIFVKNIFIG